MKKFVYGISILAILAAVVACSKTASSTVTSAKTPALSPQAELLVGTFKLENTDLAVTAEQAKQLLPLWRTYQQISTSGTAATEEINGVVSQIKSIMSAQQMEKITAMKLTQQDIMSVMSQSGVNANGANATTTPMAMNGFPGGNMPGGGTQGGGSARGSSGGGAGGPPSGGSAPGGGGMPSGGFPGGGQDMGVPGASSTPQAGQANPMSGQVPAPLLNALIDLLQKKAQ